MPEDDDLHPLVPDDDMNDLDSVAVKMPEPPPPPTRQRAVAQVRPIAIPDVVRDIASLRGYVQRASLKRKAAQISRSECEVYTL